MLRYYGKFVKLAANLKRYLKCYWHLNQGSGISFVYFISSF